MSDVTERDTFTNQKRRVATEAECRQDWRCGKNGSRFRCDMCGHRFKPGDGWRWQYSSGTKFTDDDGKTWGCHNPMVCDACDGPDILVRWAAHCAEFHSAKFWSLR
jgi:hypothetical protein